MNEITQSAFHDEMEKISKWQGFRKALRTMPSKQLGSMEGKISKTYSAKYPTMNPLKATEKEQADVARGIMRRGYRDEMSTKALGAVEKERKRRAVLGRPSYF